MDYGEFSRELPGLYDNWGQLSVRPKSQAFNPVLSQVYGMTTANVLQLLNLAVGLLEEGETYLEVGCFRGATLIGALLGHPDRRAYAVDNFSEFDPEGENARFLSNNLARFGLQNQVHFENIGFEECFLQWRTRSLKAGVYLYDGAHDYRSQLMGLHMAVPLLAERAVLVIDDGNFPPVKQATWDFVAARSECRMLFDLPTPANCHPSFWNGVLVVTWDKATANNYDWNSLKAHRQTDLLASLDALQLVNLRKRDGSIIMTRAGA
jgi:protein O-GlcNAc transferase